MQVARETMHRAVVAGLLWAWISLLLYASRNVGYMGDTLPVIGFIAVLLSGQFITRRFLRWGITVCVGLLLIKWEYYPTIAWLQMPEYIATLAGDIAFSLRSLVTGQVNLINDGVRTLAFLGVITFGTKLLEESTGRPIWLLFLLAVGEYTLVSISYDFTVTDTVEMVLFLIVGLALLAMTNFPRVQLFSARLTRIHVLRQLLAPAGVVLLMVVTGLVLPKPAGSWPKPLQWWHDLQSKASSSEAYGAHDNSLGGPFVGTNQVMMKVFADQPSYYRGESLETYSSTGWVQTSARTALVHFRQQIPAAWMAQTGATTHTPVDRFTQRVVIVRKSYPVVFGSYQMQQVTMGKRTGYYQYNRSNGSISAGAITPGTTYTVTSAEPVTTSAMLSKVHDAPVASALAPDLELPASLPERDRQLAEQITQGKSGTYAKVQAIIHYLQTHEHYQTQGIPYLQPGQDFVDQFLFVTHRGYCDHFSTALAVLSRVVGIPTRWVKGFVAVPADFNYHGATNEYVLRGTDAHSWVEVWFAGYGWIPMEATPSFVLPQQIKQVPVTQTRLTHLYPQVVKSKAALPKGISEAAALQHLLTPFAQSPALDTTWIVFASGLLVGLVWLRKRKMKGNATDARIDDLLAQFIRRLGRRRADQTLREYVQSYAQGAALRELLYFVEWYERFRYGGHLGAKGLVEGQQVLRSLARKGKTSRGARRRRIDDVSSTAPPVHPS